MAGIFGKPVSADVRERVDGFLKDARDYADGGDLRGAYDSIERAGKEAAAADKASYAREVMNAAGGIVINGVITRLRNLDKAAKGFNPADGGRAPNSLSPLIELGWQADEAIGYLGKAGLKYEALPPMTASILDTMQGLLEIDVKVAAGKAIGYHLDQAKALEADKNPAGKPKLLTSYQRHLEMAADMMREGMAGGVVNSCSAEVFCKKYPTLKGRVYLEQ